MKFLYSIVFEIWRAVVRYLCKRFWR